MPPFHFSLSKSRKENNASRILSCIIEIIKYAQNNYWGITLINKLEYSSRIHEQHRQRLSQTKQRKSFNTTAAIGKKCFFSPFQWQVTLSLARKKAKVYLYAQLTYQARYLLDLQLFKALIVIRSGFVLSIYGYVWPTIKNLVNGAGLRRD